MKWSATRVTVLTIGLGVALIASARVRALASGPGLLEFAAVTGGPSQAVSMPRRPPTDTRSTLASSSILGC